MLQGLYNSVKSYLGWDSLQVDSGGNNEDKVEVTNIEERKSLFKQLSSLMGQDITSMISLPVWVFEPLSFLQILAEPLLYADLLTKAANSPDPVERIAFISTWIVTGYGIATRTKKPFNPYLGETYELVPKDKDWKFFAEQVSHHPPISVGQAESPDFKVLLELELKTRFRGNSSDVIVNGSNHLWLKNLGEHYTWGHLDGCAHNIIVGGMWIDHFGSIEIKNEKTNEKSVITFTKTGWLGSGRYDVNIDVFDAEGNKKMRLFGKWNDYINSVTITDGVEGTPTLLWKKIPAQPESKWLWSPYTQNLNYFDSEMEAILPPDDSRFRPDRKQLELDNLDAAGKEKIKLEEAQRAKRREREARKEEWTPKYFKKVDDPNWSYRWEYFGNYWEEREERVKNANLKKSQNESKEEKKEEKVQN